MHWGSAITNCDEANLVSQDSNFLSEIYDEQYLVIHDTEWDLGQPTMVISKLSLTRYRF